jgi:hypothetical protein
MTVTETLVPSALKTLVIPIFRPIIPGMIETFYLFLIRFAGFLPQKGLQR